MKIDEDNLKEDNNTVKDNIMRKIIKPSIMNDKT